MNNTVPIFERKPENFDAVKAVANLDAEYWDVAKVRRRIAYRI